MFEIKTQNKSSNVFEIQSNNLKIFSFNKNFFLENFNFLYENNIQDKKYKIANYLNINPNNIFYISNTAKTDFLVINQDFLQTRVDDDYSISITNKKNIFFLIQNTIMPSVILYDKTQECCAIMNFNINFIKNNLIKKIINYLENYGARMLQIHGVITQNQIQKYNLTYKEYSALSTYDQDIYQFFKITSNKNIYLDIINYLKFSLQKLGINFINTIENGIQIKKNFAIDCNLICLNYKNSD